MQRVSRSLLILLCSSGLLSMSLFTSFVDAEEPVEKIPKPKVISLDLGAKEYMRVLGGPPETVTMHSGLVVLEPEKSVGTHNTENYEEVLVVLEGEGKMVITGGSTLNFKAGTVLYCPPRTEHNVFNAGSGPLRYLYIVANAE